MSYPKLTPIIAKETTEPRYLEDRFADIVSIKDFGAKGDGITSDQEAFDRAILSDCKSIFVPDGTYIINGLYITSEKHFYLTQGATIKRKSWNRTYYADNNMYTDVDAVQARSAMFTFLAGSDNSSLYGGVVDMDYWNNSSYYEINDIEAVANLNPDYDLQECVRVRSANGISIRNVVLKNSCSFALDFLGCTDAVVKDITIYNCAIAFQIMNVERGFFENFSVQKTGNRVRTSSEDSWKTNTDYLTIYQHASVFRYVNNSHIKNLTYDGYAPYQGTGTEPYPEVVSFGGVKNSTVEGIVIAGNIQVDSVRSIGMVGSGCYGVKFSDIDIRDVTTGIVLNACKATIVDNFKIDCNWYHHPTDQTLCCGIATGTGTWQQYSSDSTTDMQMNAPGLDLLFSNGYIRNVYWGVNVKTSNTVFQNVHVAGCNNGFVFRAVALVSSSGVQFKEVAAKNNRAVNCSASYCSKDGARLVDQEDTVIDSCQFYSNGVIAIDETTNEAIPTTDRCGIHIYSTNEYCQVVDCSLYNEENFTKADGLSFAPGLVTEITSGTNRLPYRFTFASPNIDKFRVGQVLSISGLLNGSNLFCTILDIVNDFVTVGFTESLTSLAVPASALSALTGTVSVSADSKEVTGVGTTFKTEIKGTTYIKIGDEYRLVQKVVDNTSLLVVEPFASAHSNVSAYRVYASTSALNASQQFGLVNDLNPDNPHPHSLFYKGNREYGNVKMPMYSSQTAICADSEWKVTYGIKDFTNAASAVVAPLSTYDVPLYWKLKVIDKCVDSNGNVVSFLLKTSDVSSPVTIASGISGQAGTVVSGVMPNVPWSEDGELAVVSEGNNVASGKVYAYVKCRRSVPNEYFD